MKRLLSDERTQNHLELLHEQLAEAIPEPQLREALSRLFSLSDAMRHDLLGLTLPTYDWRQLLRMDPDEFEQILLTQNVTL